MYINLLQNINLNTKIFTVKKKRFISCNKFISVDLIRIVTVVFFPSLYFQYLLRYERKAKFAVCPVTSSRSAFRIDSRISSVIVKEQRQVFPRWNWGRICGARLVAMFPAPDGRSHAHRQSTESRTKIHTQKRTYTDVTYIARIQL